MNLHSAGLRPVLTEISTIECETMGQCGIINPVPGGEGRGGVGDGGSGVGGQVSRSMGGG